MRRLAGDGDLVEPAALLEERLGGRQVESSERGAAEGGGRTELDDAGDAERLDRAFSLDADLPADCQMLLRRRVAVDDDFLAFGQAPLTSVSTLNGESGLAMLNPRFGAPPKTIALPFRSISCASPLTLPSASCTSGSARVCASSELETVGANVP